MRANQLAPGYFISSRGNSLIADNRAESAHTIASCTDTLAYLNSSYS